ncbi:MAG: DUF3883 domain-containing protein [Candidatus Izemoplasmatales bacterium]
MVYPNDFNLLLSDLKKGIANKDLYSKYGYNQYVGIKARKNLLSKSIDSIIITWNRSKSLYDNNIDIEKQILTYIGAGLNGEQKLGRQNSTLVNYFDNKKNIPIVFCSKIGTEIKYVSMLKYSPYGFESPSSINDTFKFYFDMYDIDVDNQTKLLSIMPNETVPWKSKKTEIIKKKKNTIKRIIGNQKLRDLIKELQFIGDLGELVVLEYEYTRLKSIGLENYIDKIEHSSILVGHGLGYDIKSYDLFNGEIKPIYIEVKSTKLNENNEFYLTENEFKVMSQKKNQFRIYRVYDIYETSDTIEIYKPPYSELDFQLISKSSYRVTKKNNTHKSVI